MKKMIINFLFVWTLFLISKNLLGNEVGNENSLCAELIEAANKGNFEYVKEKILENDKYNKCKSQSGLSLLHYAAGMGNFEMTEFLINSKNLNINEKDEDGNSPLFIAVLRNKENIVRLLILNEAEINIKNDKGQTPLLLCSLLGYETIAKLLIKNGADVNIQDEQGNTPLHMAVNKKNKNMVKLLIKNKANVFIKNNLGLMPSGVLEITSDKDNEIIRMLAKKNPTLIKEVVITRDIPLSPYRKKKNEDFNKINDKKLEDLGMIIYNNDGYESLPNYIPPKTTDVAISDIKKGKELFTSFKIVSPKHPLLEQDEDIIEGFDPVGYFMLLPKKIEKTRAIIVSAYGGLTKKESPLNIADFRYSLPDYILKYLLAHNIGIMFLNTADYIENTEFQSKMSEKIFKKVLSNIKATYDVLSKTEKRNELHILLNKIQKHLPLYLYGASFGGTVALRFAQTYPHTFNGYISHDGGLAHRSHKNYINPSLHVKELQENVLLFQNYTDNIVFVNETIDFIKVLQKSNKASQVLVHFFPQANLNNPKKSYIGHFFSSKPWYLKEYAETLVDFIEKTKNGKVKFSESIQKMRNFFYQNSFQEHEYIKKIKQKSIEQSLKDLKEYNEMFSFQRFISIGFKLYKNALICRDKRFTKREVELPREEFMKMNFETYLKYHGKKDKKDKQKLYNKFLHEALDILSEEPKKTDHSWEHAYKPLLKQLELESHETIDEKDAREILTEKLKKSRGLTLDVMRSKLRQIYEIKKRKEEVN